MTLDLLKVTLVVFLSDCISSHPWAISLGALGAAGGHCYPVFARFKGGKAVAALYGFLFGLWVVGGSSPLIFFLPLMLFLLVLYIGKIIALSSALSSVGAVVYGAVSGEFYPILIALGAFLLVILIRHRENFRRMAKGTENKISWM